jgi:tetratricopeptide (TPR) repeat protein
MMKNLVVAAVLAASATAAAQPARSPSPQATPTADRTQTDDQKRAEAKTLYEQGLSHYNLGEFDQAITAFRKSYALTQAPGLLFNIAQAFRLKKDYEQATYFYTTYLRLQPDAANRADVEARLAEMQQALDEQKKLDRKPPIGTIAPEGNTSTTTTPPPTTVTLPTATTKSTTPAPESPAEQSGARGKSLITAGYVTAGAGAALVITGLVFGRMAKSAEKDLNQLSSDMGTWTAEQQDKYDTGKRNNTIAIISFVAGGAAIATGGTLWLLGSMKKSDTTLAINPSAHGTTFAVGWSF